ncbi:nitrate ABC transporter permease [Oscillatoria sp. FACHB-1407]|uniref:nitrate ABC transporter permease n=1 Tax=Oscillatoria sp. FACHB-1407 TaxID=2692847 RepID=UPI0016889D24|nr:nitrate ABC transporter permease [Oscillatoria sp. FACHB-1407]MBD2459652.1 nitrate ABC transporter permease [Oscillatoria sp. FACHB-1407]
MTAQLSRSDRRFNPQSLMPWVGKTVRKLIPPIVAIAIFLVIWQALTTAGVISLPSPAQTIQDTWELIVNPLYDNGGTDKGLLLQIWASLGRVGIGFTLATIVGIGLGILMGTSRFMHEALDPIFQVLRTVPPLAWLPLSLAAFQQTQPSAIFVIFITAVWPIIINTAEGVRQIPQDYNNVAKVLRLSKPEYFLTILIPATVPYIFTGLRIGVGLSWLAIVAAEMLTGGVGIGFFIWDAWNSSRISDIIVALLYIGIVGFLLDRLVGWVSTLVVPQEQK